MQNYVDGKVLIITGAGSGFGKLTSEMVAERGGKVICADINEDGLKATVGGIKEKRGQADYIVTDVANKEQVDAMAKFASEKYGRIDVLVNNAGIMPLAFFSDHEKAWKAWDRCIDINLKGAIYGISAVYDQMMQQGRGHIIGVSSIYGNYPVKGGGVYSATKAGIEFLADSLRQEAQGVIKVTVIKPTGTIGTNLGASSINPAAIKGALGDKCDMYMSELMQVMQGEGKFEWKDIDSTEYLALDAVSLAKNIVYCINQPWGVSISKIEVRSTGEKYVF